MAIAFKLVFFLGFITVVCNGQSIGVASNIYDSLQPLGCSHFLAILKNCSLTVQRRYRDDVQWTLFPFSDQAFNNLPPARRTKLLDMSQEESENFVLGFTLPKSLQTTQFRKDQPEKSRSPRDTLIFFMPRSIREGNTASGIPGPTEYYANGAMVLRPNIPAGRSLIHIVDRALEEPSEMSILGYVSLQSQPDTAFFNEILTYISAQYYDATVEVLNTYKRITAFVPTRNALAKIPKEKLDVLRNNPTRLNEVAQMHIVPWEVMFTSFVYHNEGIDHLGPGQLLFRTSVAREAVYVSSGGVTAQIVHGNITCRNGAVHFIDTLMGFKYNSARDEIELSPLTQVFENLMLRARNELQQAIVAPSGVTLFVPVNAAFSNLPSFYNLNNNQSLINKIIELGLVEYGLEIELTRYNGDYAARQVLASRYFRRPINVYSQGNETWIESGYVKARVVRPDIGVTNGYIHFIDGVPGVPTRDVPNTIFCEDWLLKSSTQLSVTGLNDFMRDQRISTVAPCTTSGGVRSNADVFQSVIASNSKETIDPCVGNCQFTIFIPNGTAIDHFENMATGKQIQNDVRRWRFVLARHITRQLIYLDQIAVGTERSFTALNGDVVRFRRATDRYAYLYHMGQQARVLHSDLGATNGVVHILDQVIFVTSDLTRTDFGLSTSSGHRIDSCFILCLSLCLAVLWHRLLPRL